MSLSVLSLGYALDYRCPERIETKQSLKISAHEDFEPLTNSFEEYQNLDLISLYSGHPKQGASLVPTDESNAKEPFWNFQPNDEFGVWMKCGYANTTVSLVRKLPPTTKKCTLKHKTKPKNEKFLSCH